MDAQKTILRQLQYNLLKDVEGGPRCEPPLVASLQH